MATHEQLEAENSELETQLADPAVLADPAKLATVAKRKAEIERQLDTYRTCADEAAKVVELEELVAGSDAEMAKMAEDELVGRRKRLAELDAAVAELARPSDPAEQKPAILEIRAGAGGDEASLFAKELYGAYQRYAEDRGWPVEVLTSSASEAGGFKEMIVLIKGDGAYGRLRFEAGTHRVQRVPVTESGGRIHTSTVTVAVLPETEEQELEISPEEIRVDVFRSSGPGGQSVNTTDSAVRITHIPTGITVSCQDEKSQHKNRAKAMSILRSRLKAQQEAEAAAERGDARRQQIGTGDRSEKIRTYNIPQDRVTDHRISLTKHGVAKVLAGELDPLIDALRQAEQDNAEG